MRLRDELFRNGNDFLTLNVHLTVLRRDHSRTDLFVVGLVLTSDYVVALAHHFFRPHRTTSLACLHTGATLKARFIHSDQVVLLLVKSVAGSAFHRFNARRLRQLRNAAVFHCASLISTHEEGPRRNWCVHPSWRPSSSIIFQRACSLQN